ncbi:MAG TPA: MlaA family lipoprotein [Candidatus Wunengus sp. YC60]|uniref:MlaA family lipoprotein n=1 Tax=Candidatus Wunengus sp. YC60 TaxID=3367697 RepID=UPI0040253C06
MRKPVFLMLVVVFTICLCKEFVCAEDSAIPEGQPVKTAQEVETPIINKANEEGELKPIVQAGQFDKTPKEDKTPAITTPEDEEQENKDDIKPETPLVKDPLQPYNRAIFAFNDKAYHYFIKPIYTGYNSMVPEKARVSVRNFFTNIKMPVRFFNCLFQGELKGAGTELARFVINSTVGVAGFFDPAKSKFHLQRQERDFGQTLAKHKVNSGIYIVWPFLGPSTVRDTAGLAGDAVLNPISWVSYFFLTPLEGFGNYSYDTVNDISIDKGQTYESVTKPAIDPYIALQDAYVQNRIKKIKD